MLNPTISKTLANQFRSTFVYGTFNNLDNSSNSIPARAAFQRDVLVGNNLFLGNAAVDASGAFLDSTSNFQFTLNKEIVSIPVRCLNYIKNVTSDIQQQIIDLSNNIVNNGGGEQSSTFTNLTVTGTLNGLILKNYGNGNTSFSSGNTEILGNSNSRFGYFTGFLSGYSNVVFGDQSLQNCTGNSNTAIGHNSQNGNTSYNYNTSLGSESNIIGDSYNIAIGHRAQCSNCSNSVVIGNGITCTTNNEILLGSSVHNVVIPGNLTFLQNLNNISSSTLGYLSGVTSSIQSQINTSNSNISTLQNKTTDMIWAAGQVNKTTISNQCETTTLSFSNTLNNISTTTFGFLSGVTSSIQNQLNSLQNQINALINNTPVGIVIAFAGSSSSLSGYLLCDGSYYNSSNYNALFNAIGYTYGGENGNFRVPNYKGIFLRGAGQQNIQLNVIAGNGGAIFKSYESPELGHTVRDQSTQFTTSEFVDHIHTEVRAVVTGSTDFMAAYQYTNAISSLNFTTSNNTFNYGNPETYPVHASVQYFIKY